jgi:hypothetical protein
LYSNCYAEAEEVFGSALVSAFRYGLPIFVPTCDCDADAANTRLIASACGWM